LGCLRGGLTRYNMNKPLDGLRILVLDDELLAAMDLAHMIKGLGATVVGPVGTLAEAEQLAREPELHGAILDVKIQTTTSLPLAVQLQERGVSVVLATGYGSNMLPERFEKVPKLAKPYGLAAVRKITEEHFSALRQPAPSPELTTSRSKRNV
jgi:CheY-like chemotaxis protein